jgi:hypothetical protein
MVMSATMFGKCMHQLLVEKIKSNVMCYVLAQKNECINLQISVQINSCFKCWRVLDLGTNNEHSVLSFISQAVCRECACRPGQASWPRGLRGSRGARRFERFLLGRRARHGPCAACLVNVQGSGSSV